MVPKGVLKDLKKMAELLADNPQVFVVGRIYGCRIGITRKLAVLLKEHCGSAGELLAANCMEIENDDDENDDVPF